MDPRTQSSLIAALLCFALGASLLLRSRRQRAHWLFAIFAGATGLWYVGTFMLGIMGHVPFWERFHQMAGVLVPLSAVRFFAVMVPEDSARMRVLGRAAVITGVVLLGAMLTPLYERPVVNVALLFYVIIFLVTALFNLYRLGLKTTSRIDGARLRYVALVGALGGIFTLVEYLPYIGLDIPPVGTVLVMVFLYALSQSIAHYRLLDLYELAGRLGVLTTLSFMLATMLWLLQVLLGDQFFLHTVVATFIILILFDPVRSKVQETISQVFFHERFELERTILALRRSVAHMIKADDLGDQVMSGLATSPRITEAALYLLAPDGRTFVLRGFVGPRPAERVELAPARPLLDRLVKNNVAILENTERELDECRGRGDDREAETLHDIVVTLRALRASVCLGVQGEAGDLYGLLMIRDDRLRDAFSPEEVQLFAGLAAQIAVTVENSELYEQMKERDRLAALGEMSAGLAHEIRNPLGSIKASAQFLSDVHQISGGGREFLDIIVDETDRLNRVVGSFLDYARPAQGDPEPIFVNAAVHRTLQLLRPECDAHDISLHISMDPDLPQVRIDVEHLRQVLINLLQNAIQAMPEGGQISVETRTRDRLRIGTPDQRWVQIGVKDDGPGIPDELLANLFVPFVTTKQRGTGLGLAISQRIIAEAGGRIEVRTIQGAGTTFVVLLPAEPAAPEVAASSSPEEPEAEGSSEPEAASRRLEPAAEP